jgi:hypothetical protein
MLSVVEQEPGVWVMKKTTDSTVTLPFRWTLKASAVHDLSTVVKGLLLKGFTVINEKGEEVLA